MHRTIILQPETNYAIGRSMDDQEATGLLPFPFFLILFACILSYFGLYSTFFLCPASQSIHDYQHVRSSMRFLFCVYEEKKGETQYAKRNRLLFKLLLCLSVCVLIVFKLVVDLNETVRSATIFMRIYTRATMDKQYSHFWGKMKRDFLCFIRLDGAGLCCVRTNQIQ